MDKVNLSSMTLEEIRSYIEDLGEKSYRAEQIFSFINKEKVDDIKDITVLSKAFREELRKKAYINKVSIFKKLDSELDDTRKFLFLLDDGNIVEGVAMHYKHGWSACISTQVGCKMGCSFCASTKDGLIRNLESGEMAGQIYSMEKDIGDRISNIVLMGSGEPLDNYDNVLKFFEIIHDEKGKNLSYRNITLSTCGIVPKIYELADVNIPITLSISLHSPFEDDRRKIMPIANRYSIEEIIEACKYYEEKTSRRITMEYTLIEGVNDDRKNADELVRILKGLNVHVNLIPLNPIEEYKEGRPTSSSIRNFSNMLTREGIQTTIRREMGSDINASCGQLRRRYV